MGQFTTESLQPPPPDIDFPKLGHDRATDTTTPASPQEVYGTMSLRKPTRLFDYQTAKKGTKAAKSFGGPHTVGRTHWA